MDHQETGHHEEVTEHATEHDVTLAEGHAADVSHSADAHHG